MKVILVDEVDGLRNAQRRELDGFNGVTREVLRALVPLARAAGLRTVAHVDTAADFKLAVDAGVDTIAYLPGYRIAKNRSVADYQLTEDVVKAAAANAVAVIPTMAASVYHTSAHPKDASAIAEDRQKTIQRPFGVIAPRAKSSVSVQRDKWYLFCQDA